MHGQKYPKTKKQSLDHMTDYLKKHNHGWLSSSLAGDIVPARTPASSQHSYLRPGSNNLTGIKAANTGIHLEDPKQESSLLLQRGASHRHSPWRLRNSPLLERSHLLLLKHGKAEGWTGWQYLPYLKAAVLSFC